MTRPAKSGHPQRTNHKHIDSGNVDRRWGSVAPSLER